VNSSLSGQQLVELKNNVVRDFDDSNWRELGALTNTLDQVESHDRLLRSLSWRDPDYDGLALTFLRKMIGVNDENLEIVIQYVTKKCTSFGENISSGDDVDKRKIVFAPSIFDIPNVSVDTNRISVMMPFGQELKPVYKSI